MGSQSVTNFSEVRMKKIRSLVRDYSDTGADAPTRARQIGAAAVGAVTGAPAEVVPRKTKKRKRKGGEGGATGAAETLKPTNEFLQALTSHRVKEAIDLFMDFANELQQAKDPETVYAQYGIRLDAKEPLNAASGVLGIKLSEKLGPQAKTDLGFAGQDAITKTVIDVVRTRFPQESNPAKIDRKRFAQAFKDLGPGKVLTLFLQNVASALVNLALDATRTRLSKPEMERVKQKVREEFIPEFIEQLISRSVGKRR
jgi:hypothetical protein